MYDPPQFIFIYLILTKDLVGTYFLQVCYLIDYIKAFIPKSLLAMP